MDIISVWSPKGGVGKSTLSLSLAGGLMKRGFHVEVYDLDPQKSSIDVAAKGLLPFEVRDTATRGKLPEIALFDHPPGFDNTSLPPSQAKLIVVPLRPAYLDLGSLSRAMSATPSMQNRGIIPVFNSWDPRRQEHVELAQAYPTWPCVSNRSVFERMIKHGVTLYDPMAANWYGAKESRIQLERVIDLMLYKLHGTVPKTQESREALAKVAAEAIDA